MLSRNLLVQAAALAVGAAAGGSVSCPADVPVSCQATYTDTCCFNSPGGQILLTQFWDTNPSTGPIDSWTIHGLWPDNCDGSYEQYCDSSREVSNVTEILKANAPCTLKYMQTFWKDYKGDDEDFWEHEFNKHGTCMSTLEPKCYPSYQPHQEVVDYFKRAVKVDRTLPTYKWLAAAGIVPSTSKTYTLAEIQAALSKNHGYEVIIRCSSGELNELWYHYNIRGSIQSGQFVPVAPVGSPSNCPSTGIKYLPKDGTNPSPPTKTSTSPGSTPTAAPGQLSGKGFLYATTPGQSNGGFLISKGTWYRDPNGTPAGYTATPNSDGKTFTLKTSKGNCAVKSDTLSCDTSNSSPSSFGFDGTYLTFGNSNTFYATDLPTGQTQGTVYTTPKSVSFQVTWKAS
ncbi:hypothetical protein V2G26_005694 [Clonostachys chloroleuca]